jgi:Protein of unknown function (DUF3592)
MHEAHNESRSDAGASRGRRLAEAFVLSFAILGLAVYPLQVLPVLQARQWPMASGQIVDQSVAYELFYVRIGKSSNRDVKEERIRVKFRYETGGVSRVGTRISPIRAFEPATQEGRARLAVGTQVLVHYDPDAPDNAVIDVSLPWGAIVGSLLGLSGVLWAASRWGRDRATSGIGREHARQAEA